jgi:hypothetical protein
MLDLVSVISVALLFAIALGYVAACDRLKGPRP